MLLQQDVFEFSLSSEAWCTAIHMKMSLICMRMKTHFLLKGWAPRLALRKRRKVIRKWPIVQGSSLDHSIWILVSLTKKTTVRLNPASSRTASGGLSNCHGNQFQSHVVLASTCCCIQRQTFFPTKPDITQGLDV